jgi:glyoxylate/hydroxypyruvate reductase A
MARLLVHLTGLDEERWATAFADALPDHEVFRRDDVYDPAGIDYIFVWKPLPDAFEGLSGLKAVLSYGAGVDALLQHPRLPRCPIVRFIDADLTQRMTDYVLQHVLLHARLHLRFAADQSARRWTPRFPPPAGDVVVGVMGLGVLGMAAARLLSTIGFKVRGWSRSAKTLPGIDCFDGAGGIASFLAGTDILVNLLPLTPATRGILNYETFRQLQRPGPIDGPVVINAARGGHLNESHLHRALTDGTLGAASLDVFEHEPLDARSPLWALPNCVITPHVAATSGTDAGVAYFAAIIEDHEAGGALPNVVDIARGY